MPDWLKRYKQGEHAAIWAEMDALGPDIRKKANLTEARKVATETMTRAQRNIESLIAALPTIGYCFAAPGESATMSWALELRLSNAVAYAKNSGKKYEKDPWSHPALQWVELEEPPVPVPYLEGRPAWTVHRLPSTDVKIALDNLETKLGGPLPLSLRAFWELVGSVSLAGSHPLLNPKGGVQSLMVAPYRKAGALAPKAAVGTGAGAQFIADLRRAFEWSGFPGWEGHPDPPKREIDFLRAKLSPL